MKKYLDRVILHMDGDAFFASVEQALNWRLRGKPVITGGERFIAASMSYEAKACGVTRGMRIQDIRKVCPEAIVVASDYVTYGIFARRMYNIVRRYTPTVEEYSIDECFADLTGLDKTLGMSYEEISKKIKSELESKLGITFGVGLSSTKVLAKVASKHRKPAGFTYIPNDPTERRKFLAQLPIEKVWGIGTSTTRSLRAKGIVTALDFAGLSSHQLSALSIAKPYREIHAELNGISVLVVNSEKREMPKSVMSSRTFTPPSHNLETVFSHLSKNIEEACERLRYVHAEAKECSFYIKSQEFRYYGREYKFETPTNDPAVVIKAARSLFSQIFKTHLDYRATGISLRALVPEGLVPHQSLFANTAADIAETKLRHHLYEALDKVNRKYGDHVLMFGSSLSAVNYFGKKRKARGKAGKTWELPFLGKVRA